MNSSQRMKVEVSLASHVHQMPHTGSRPQRAGDQANGAADDADFDAGDTEGIPFAIAGDEIGDAGVEGDEEGAEHGVPAGHVEIEYALDGVHGRFVRRDEQRGVACAEDQQGDERGDW